MAGRGRVRENGRPLHVAHVVFRFDYGGLENGLVNLINTLDARSFRHTVIALTEATTIRNRIDRPDVDVIALGKRPGKDIFAYVRLFRLLRHLRPDILHTRNIGTLDCQLLGWLARVPVRVHGEHGWDTHDPEGRRPRYRWMRRVLFPLVDRVVVLSQELESWLQQTRVIARTKTVRICNGVDCVRFQPGTRAGRDDVIRFGSVTRFTDIKDPLNVLRAFDGLRRLVPDRGPSTELVMVGDGPLIEDARRFVAQSGLSAWVTFAGEQLDVEPWLDQMDVFVLGSRREGISNTVLEAMAKGLPVVATRVGGNPELVAEGETGVLVPAEDSPALAEAMAQYVDDRLKVVEHGRNARDRAVSRFSLQAMTQAYGCLYSGMARNRGLVRV